MTDTKQKPDGSEITGYVAWHPVDGVYKHDALISPQKMTPFFLAPMTINHADRWLGWAFRPVKLVFLDEGEK